MNKAQGILRRISAITAVMALGIGGLAACGSSNADPAKGKVYYINSKPEVADIWQDVADQYTKETGVEVIVETAAAGTLDQTLKSELAKSEAPTLLTINGFDSYARYKSHLADISGSDAYQLLTDEGKAYANGDGKAVYTIPFAAEYYGMIYNKKILKDYIAKDYAVINSVDDIKDFKTFKKVCDSMQEHKDDLGLEGVISNAGLDASDTYRFASHLSRIPLFYEYKDAGTTFEQNIKGTYLDDMKNIWDLYLKDSTVQPTELSSKTYEDSTAEFATGQTAFYQNGVWSYTQIKDNDVADEDLGMLPLYIGAPGESAYGPASIYDASWGVNEDSSDKDKQATLDFLKWLVSSDEGRKALSQDMGFSAPYTTFGKDDQPNNPLITAALEYQEKNIPFIRSFALPSGHWGDELANALLDYTQGTSDWSAVKKAYVDNWSSEWQNNKETNGSLPESQPFKG
ncbi:MAG: ABC transporter substrate-binding protein [Bifidobacterium scardovii]|uniref:ABC transporter substrate-binding protein n=1 Tax=Bifidobacterium scardovii TaxID=158787 RepID=UPI0028FF2495|nr:ABC transporter substrate-binding protein [Bifidobacterium scardovii]MDU2422012.1 ABC transporter substrate-binding protein [Bifidobacterium scardovii]